MRIISKASDLNAIHLVLIAYCSLQLEIECFKIYLFKFMTN